MPNFTNTTNLAIIPLCFYNSCPTMWCVKTLDTFEGCCMLNMIENHLSLVPIYVTDPSTCRRAESLSKNVKQSLVNAYLIICLEKDGFCYRGNGRSLRNLAKGFFAVYFWLPLPFISLALNLQHSGFIPSFPQLCFNLIVILNLSQNWLGRRPLQRCH